MGYSIYTITRDIKTAEAVKDVFRYENILLNELQVGFASGDELAYYQIGHTRKDMCVGFNYGANANCPAWTFASLLALAVGKRRKFKDIELPCPFVIYDGVETIPVVTEPQEGHCHLVDGLGISLDVVPGDEYFMQGGALVKQCTYIRSRLDFSIIAKGLKCPSTYDLL